MQKDWSTIFYCALCTVGVCVIMLIGFLVVKGSFTTSEPITEIKFTEMYCPECGAPLEFELEVCEED